MATKNACPRLWRRAYACLSAAAGPLSDGLHEHRRQRGIHEALRADGSSKCGPAPPGLSPRRELAVLDKIRARKVAPPLARDAQVGGSAAGMTGGVGSVTRARDEQVGGSAAGMTGRVGSVTRARDAGRGQCCQQRCGHAPWGESSYVLQYVVCARRMVVEYNQNRSVIGFGVSAPRNKR